MRWFLGIVDKIDDAVTEAVDDAVEYGADVMRDLIRNSGTGHTWSETWNTLPNAYEGRTQSYPGRVAGGGMLDGVTSESGRTGANTYEGEFGWVGPAEDYWLSQEHGFKHNFTSAQVDGMNALGDSYQVVSDELERSLDDRLKNV